MKRTLLLLLLTIVAQMGYSQSVNDLVGHWERVGGNFDGMKMEIHANDRQLEGILLTNSEGNYFEEGDVKWKGLEKVEGGRFVVKSLYIELGIDNEPIATHYIEKTICFITANKICVVSKKYDVLNSSGHIQYWVRKNSI